MTTFFVAVLFLFVFASAAGWVLIPLVAVDVVRYRRAGRKWRVATTRDGDRP